MGFALLIIGIIVGFSYRNSSVVEAIPGNNSLISVSSSGTQGNSDSGATTLSKDGRYVTFSSTASNLVSGDTNGVQDIFLRDTVTGATTRIDVDSSGAQSNAGSGGARISSSGKCIVYYSTASNLVSGDTNGVQDIFLYTISTGNTTRISLDSSGNEANNSSFSADVDAECRFVTFDSIASNLVPTDTNTTGGDIFVRDTQLNTTRLIDISTAGVQATGDNQYPRISCDGRFVTWRTWASNLDTGDTNGNVDVVITDLLGNQVTTNITKAGNGGSSEPAISCSGDYVVFPSNASNLVPSDTNGIVDIFRYDRVAKTTMRVSLTSSGTQVTSGGGVRSDISSDGNFVTWDTSSSQFDPTDTNGFNDIYLRNISAGTTELVSVTPSLGLANNNSYFAEISDDASKIAYNSSATNLVSSDTNNKGDVFVSSTGTSASCTY